MNYKGKYFIIILSLLLLHSQSHAGAWLPNKNENQIIISAIQNNDNNQNFEVYFEHGLNDKLALVYEQGFASESGENEVGEALLAARYRIFKKSNWVASTQFGLVTNSISNTQDPKTSYELRALLGYGFSKGWTNLEIGTRDCSGANSLRWEGTMGFNIAKSDKLIVKAFGENDGCFKGINRAQVSYVKAINSKFAIELGYREGIGRDKIFDDGKILIGIWAKF